MSTGLERISVSEFTRRMIEREGSTNWFMLVALDREVEQVAQQIAYGVEQEADEGQVVVVARPANVDALVGVARQVHAVVIVGVDGWTMSELARLDALRSRLLASHKLAFVMGQQAATRMFREAPHFVRLFSGSVWESEGESEMSEVERLRRVESLEAWAGMSSEEMVRRAEAKALRSDPEFVEWLVLVDRSDLL